LAQGLSLQANYQEARADNQGSASTLALSTSAVALTSALKVDSLQFIRSIDAHGTATGQTNLNWTTRLIGGVAVSGQFQAKDADGQGYSFNRTFDLTQKVSDTTSLVASFARQENGGQRVMGTKRLTLARNDPQNRLGYSVTYDEMPDPQAQAVIRPVLQGKAMLGNGKGASLTWEYVQRDQADNSRLISKQIHAVLPLPSGFMLQGDYAKNPYDPNNRDKIQSFTMNQCWTLVGPIGGKAKLSVAYTSAGNLQAFTEADTTDVSLTASPSRNATFAFGFRLLKNYAPGSNSSRQGFIANYTRELDENHYLRISATDEPQEVGFINGMARCTSPTDSRLYLEYGTSF
jgi:hypothetical protein